VKTFVAEFNFHEQGEKMKKLFVVLGLVGLFSIPAFADVDCKSVTVCTLARPEGGCHPAVLFNVVTAQIVSGTFSVCDGPACSGICSDPAPFDFPLNVGPSGVFLTFFEEPLDCTELSTQWVVDACPSACGDHHCVTPTCPAGAELFLQEIQVRSK
jgi:hypothetical protein